MECTTGLSRRIVEGANLAIINSKENQELLAWTAAKANLVTVNNIPTCVSEVSSRRLANRLAQRNRYEGSFFVLSPNLSRLEAVDSDAKEDSMLFI